VWYNQIALGIAYGCITAEGGWQIIRTKTLQPAVEKYVKLTSQLNLKTLDIIVISFCAGFGEELLFRASIQPFLGIAFTSVLFVALHGYLNPRDWRISIYGLYMTAVIAGMGWLFRETGILTAAIAHMVIDIILLARLKNI
jgi:uncharacterized protein